MATIMEITYYECKCLGEALMKKNKDGKLVVADRHADPVYVAGLGNCVVGQEYTLDHWQAKYYGAAFDLAHAKTKTKQVKMDDETVDMKNAPMKTAKKAAAQKIYDEEGRELTEEQAKELKLMKQAAARGFRSEGKKSAVELMNEFDALERARNEGTLVDTPEPKPASAPVPVAPPKDEVLPAEEQKAAAEEKKAREEKAETEEKRKAGRPRKN